MKELIVKSGMVKLFKTKSYLYNNLNLKDTLYKSMIK